MANVGVPRTRNWLRRRWIIVGLAILLVIIAGWFIANSNKSSAAAKNDGTVAVTRGSLIATVTGSGPIAAEQVLSLTFQDAGTVTQVLVKAGDTVTAGQPLACLDDRLLQIQVANAQAGLASAQARLVQARQGNARPEDIAAAQAALKSAQAGYDAAVKSAGTTGSQLEAAKAAMLKAQTALQQAQSVYDTVAWRPDVGMMQQSINLQNATVDYNQAKANYDTLLATAKTDADSRTQTAASQLEQAKTNLSKLTAPATGTDLTIQQAAVAQAEQSLKQAQLNLEAATLNAPFAGVVTVVNVIPGSPVAASTNVVTLMDRSRLHVDLRLNENDVTRVQLNQPVTVTIDSLAGWSAAGQVNYIAPASEVVNGVVTYAVRVTFSEDDPRVKVGMTTNLNIVTARKDNALLVPNSALLPKDAGRVVQMPTTDGKDPREVDVQIGLSDGVMTEIVGGLKEGDRIIAAPQPKRKGGLFGG